MSRTFIRRLRDLARSNPTEKRSLGRGGRRKRSQLGNRWRLPRLEPLEVRRVLTSTVYIDFGNNFPVGGLQMTAMELRDSINGPDINSQVFMGGTAIPLGETIVMSQDVPLNVQVDILPIVQRAFEPYAINVLPSSASSVADVQALYALNNGDPTGEFDAWIPVVDIRSTVTDAGVCNFSVGCLIGGNFGLGGLSPTVDLGMNANTRDDAPLIFSDRLNTVAESLAWGIAHEVAHSLSLQHLDASNNTGPNATLLTSSEMMKQFGFQQYNGLFGRFTFPVGNGNVNPAVTADHYNRLSTDPDIGLRDVDANGIPDFAYSTGTGAHDQVILGDQAGQVDVDVNAYSDPARTNLIQAESYTIDLATDTDGEILVDAGRNNDQVQVDAVIAASMRLRGGTSASGGVTQNDQLTLQSGGLSGTFTPGPDGINGSVVYVGGADIDFSEFENVEADNVSIDSITLDLSAGTSVDEGEQFVLDVEFVNIDTMDSHDVLVDWGNGEMSMVTLSPGERDTSLIYEYPDDHPASGTAFDGFTINVTVTDQDGDSGEANAGIVVNNVAPEILNLELGVDQIDEGDSVTVTGFFGDPALVSGATTETWTGLALWSDGVETPLAIDQSDGTFQTERLFLDDDPSTGTPFDQFTVAITIDDDDLGTDSAESSVLTVNNVDPIVTNFASDATFDNKGKEGEPVNIVGNFTDVGVLDIHVAEVDWGDGSPLETITLVQGAGFGSVTGSHIYDAGGIYTITVTVTDDDTGSQELSSLAVITGVGVNQGVLYVIGDASDNQVNVHQVGKDRIRVHANFVPDAFRTFEIADVDRIIAYLCDGDDHMTLAGNVASPATIHGGQGDDHLKAGSGAAALIGGAGNDRLIGGAASTLLIGGTGQDRLVGGRADDILIGGSTDIDADDDALLLVLDGWTSNGDYAARVAAVDLSFVVTDDLDKDRITGSSGRDLFYDGLDDQLLGRKNNETIA